MGEKIKIDFSSTGGEDSLFINGIPPGNPIDSILPRLSEKLQKAFADKNLPEIFQLTSDFQQMHILPDGNGRVSQVTRDCFALAMEEYPFPPLTEMSHYMCMTERITKEHMDFMQENFDRLLISVENKSLTRSECKKNSKEEIQRLRDTAKRYQHPSIDLDIDNILRRHSRMRAGAIV